MRPMRIRAFAIASLAALVLAAVPACGARQVWEPVGLCGGGGLFNPVVSPHDAKMMMVESDMGGRYISRDGGRMWKMIHFQQLGAACRGARPLFHPTRGGVIYALRGFSANTIHTSSDNGRTWTAWPRDRQPGTGVILRFLVDPARPQRLYIGTAGGKVMYTDDEGGTWRAAGGVTGAVDRFVIDRSGGKDKRALLVATSAGVFRSEDGGATFARRVKGLPEGKALAAFAGGCDGKRTVLYAAVPCWLEKGKLRGGVYASGDGASTWRRVMNPKIDVTTERSSRWASDLPQYSHLVCSDADPMRAYAYCRGTSYFPPNHSTIYRTDDAGASWRAVFFVDPRFKQHNVGWDWMTSYMRQSWVGRPIDMEISDTDGDVVMRSDGMFLFFTRNGGRSWMPGHAVLAAAAKTDRQRVWLNNGLVNTTTWHYYVDPHRPRIHYIAYTDIGFARSADGGRTWRWWGPGGGPSTVGEDQPNDFPIPRAWINTCYELAFDPDVPGRIWGAFSGHHDIPNENSIWRGTGKSGHKGGLAVSGDFGRTWKALRQGLPEKPALSVVLDPKSPRTSRTLYAAIYDHGVYKTTDGGAGWTKMSEGLGHPENMRICRLVLHPDGTLFGLITGMRKGAREPFKTEGVGLYRRAPAEGRWERVNASRPLLYPKDFGVDPADSRHILIGACDTPQTRTGGLWRTRDGGKTWKRVLRKRRTHFGAYFHPKRDGWIYATCCGWTPAPEGSLFLSTDDGKTWRGFDGLPFAQINRVDFDPHDPSVIYVTTFGGSVWKGPAAPP